VRRPLHCLLVAILIFSLSVDTARACWHLRHAHRVHAAHACWPAAPRHGGWSHAVVVSDVAVGWGWSSEPCAEVVVIRANPCVEEIACGPTVVGCAPCIADVATETVIAEHSVVTSAPAPVVAAPTPQPRIETPPVVAEVATNGSQRSHRS